MCSLSFSHSGIARRKLRKPARRVRQIRFEQALELRERLVVEGDVIELLGRQARLVEAVIDRVGGKSRSRAFCG